MAGITGSLELRPSFDAAIAVICELPCVDHFKPLLLLGLDEKRNKWSSLTGWRDKMKPVYLKLVVRLERGGQADVVFLCANTPVLTRAAILSHCAAAHWCTVSECQLCQGQFFNVSSLVQKIQRCFVCIEAGLL